MCVSLAMARQGLGKHTRCKGRMAPLGGGLSQGQWTRCVCGGPAKRGDTRGECPLWSKHGIYISGMSLMLVPTTNDPMIC